MAQRTPHIPNCCPNFFIFFSNRIFVGKHGAAVKDRSYPPTWSGGEKSTLRLGRGVKDPPSDPVRGSGRIHPPTGSGGQKSTLRPGRRVKDPPSEQIPSVQRNGHASLPFLSAQPMSNKRQPHLCVYVVNGVYMQRQRTAHVTPCRLPHPSATTVCQTRLPPNWFRGCPVAKPLPQISKLYKNTRLLHCFWLANWGKQFGGNLGEHLGTDFGH